MRQGVPFREAHEVAGAHVRAAEAKGTDLDGLTDAGWPRCHRTSLPRFAVC